MTDRRCRGSVASTVASIWGGEVREKPTASDPPLRMGRSASMGRRQRRRIVYFAADGRWRASYRVPRESGRRTVSAATREKACQASASARGTREAAGSPRCDVETDDDRGAGSMVASTTCNATRCARRHGPRPMTAAPHRRDFGLHRGRQTARRTVVTWQSTCLKTLAPKTVGHHRQTCPGDGSSGRARPSRCQSGTTRQGTASAAHDRSCAHG